MITQEYIRSLFEYKDGFLYWKIKANKNVNNIKIGSKAGSFHKSSGYYRISINGKRYLNHQLIFLYNNGFIPKEIDHIDNNKLNNNIENLREVTRSQNQMNRKPHKNTSSQYKGVSWNKQANKWYTQIYINGKKKYLGYFINEIDAVLAYNKAAIKLFGEYAYLNEI